MPILHTIGGESRTPEEWLAIVQDGRRYRTLRRFISERSLHNDLEGYSGDVDSTLDRLVEKYPTHAAKQPSK